MASTKQTLDDLLDSGIWADTKEEGGKLAINYAKQAGLTWAFEKFKSALKCPESPNGSSHSDPEPHPEPAQGVRGVLKTGQGRFAKRF